MTTNTPHRLVITLELPARELSPNWRGHWARKAKAVRAMRNETMLRAKAALRKLGCREPWPRAELAPKFYFTTRRRRDRDNLAASLKAARDGIADSGLVSNDVDIVNRDPEIIVDKTSRARVELWLARIG